MKVVGRDATNRWILLVGLASALAIAIALFASYDLDAPTPGSSPAVDRADGRVAPAASSMGVQPNPRQAAWPPREPALAETARLFGTVTFADGAPVPDARVELRRDGELRTLECGPEGSYSLAELTPGEWQVLVHGEGAVEFASEVGVRDRAQQERSFVLQRVYSVGVRVLTAAGDNAMPALDPGVRHWLHVVGDAQPIPEWIAPADHRGVALGDARWHPSKSWSSGFAGTLHLAAPPPQHAALLYRHVVIQRQTLDVGQTEVAFVIDVDAVEGLMGSVSASLVDASGRPIGGAWVDFGVGRHGYEAADSSGRVSVASLPPGWLRFSVHAPEREIGQRMLRLRPGQDLDLGDIVLEPAVPLRVVVEDAAGRPVVAQLRWSELRWHTPGTDFYSNRLPHPDPAGGFDLFGTGPGAIAVAAWADGRVAMAIVESPSAQPVVLRVAEPGRCTVTRPVDPARAFSVTLLDASDRPLTSIVLAPHVRERTLLAPVGQYTVEVHDQDQRLVHSGTLDLRPTTARLVIE